MDDAILRAARLLREAKSIVCFSGAGLSAESGVPTFRDRHAVSGALWEKYDPMTLASPQGFAADPQAVVAWYNWRRQAIGAAQPNAAHRALAGAGVARVRNVTQNVDDLLERAGAEDVIHLHGSIALDHCQHRCGFEERIDLRDPPGLRSCPNCGGQARLRPGVVWFGEALPDEAWSAANRACEACEALLAVGTSAVVYPAAGLVSLAKAHGARIVIVNTRRSDASHLANVEVLAPAAQALPRMFME